MPHLTVKTSRGPVAIPNDWNDTPTVNDWDAAPFDDTDFAFYQTDDGTPLNEFGQDSNDTDAWKDVTAS